VAGAAILSAALLYTHQRQRAAVEARRAAEAEEAEKDIFMETAWRSKDGDGDEFPSSMNRQTRVPAHEIDGSHVREIPGS
jgi:hypothetical protein